MKLTKLKAHELIDGYKNRDFSCEEVTREYLSVIEREEADLNAYVTVCDESAIKEAKEVDRKFMNREEVGILSGVPIGVKDNIAVKNILMTCSSKMLENFIVPYDSVISERIKSNGGVIIGKTNMDEFAMGASTKTSYYGVSKNPLDRTLVSGGSSGGSASALAGEECALAVGTDTGGSTRQPASFCGLVGIKPTYGSIPRYGVATMANTFDQPGAFGKDVEDAVLLLKALEGRDERDATSVGNPSIREEFNFKNTDEVISYLKNMKIAIPSLYMNMKLNDRVKADFDKAINVFKNAGAIIDIVDMSSLKYVIETYHILVNGEIAPNMARFDGLRYGHRTENYDTFEEMYRKSRAEGFGDEVKRRIMIGTHILSLDLAEDYYYKALKVRTLIKNEFDEVFKSHNLVMCPTVPVLPFKIEDNMSPVEMYQADLFTIPANMTGCPSISIPMPKIDGLSVGIELTANRFKDNEMIKAALGFERSVK
ncbi:Asp-tRNA(Asn)/Glu-tRNA(Gln) amidotransferase subunit GatA [Peptoniphilus sp. oral taxon 386]|uniref:Asp-tRNA(Asn)/Glu-tRNA(Gln) amidotransferase subunit GatA n=1 Tax=Peptoniphilus sp. oral taxon 386 TaxID=652713 RepID=UPI0001DA9BE1|nr:Asp-tRNA(Asn)/Glu-tRNA(Gln) amidotransferase subunit GatA [Peptoniphilus sp. oral taxon 386]EFI42580.1 aspartyl/glutamyl-tRNA(Asn/Gln) amidotransferase, A subunit [Peptoniphilus sp. oral taxon 386 str. F0131]